MSLNHQPSILTALKIHGPLSLKVLHRKLHTICGWPCSIEMVKVDALNLAREKKIIYRQIGFVHHFSLPQKKKYKPRKNVVAKARLLGLSHNCVTKSVLDQRKGNSRG